MVVDVIGLLSIQSSTRLFMMVDAIGSLNMQLSTQQLMMIDVIGLLSIIIFIVIHRAIHGG